MANVNMMNKINLALTRVKLTDKLFFTQNLSLMVKSGISLARALDSLSQQTENITMRFVLDDIKERVKKGESLANAMRNHKKVFSDIFVSFPKN